MNEFTPGLADRLSRYASAQDYCPIRSLAYTINQGITPAVAHIREACDRLIDRQTVDSFMKLNKPKTIDGIGEIIDELEAFLIPPVIEENAREALVSRLVEGSVDWMFMVTCNVYGKFIFVEAEMNWSTGERTIVFQGFEAFDGLRDPDTGNLWKADEFKCLGVRSFADKRGDERVYKVFKMEPVA